MGEAPLSALALMPPQSLRRLAQPIFILNYITIIAITPLIIIPTSMPMIKPVIKSTVIKSIIY